jgi:hypothetical protein
LLAIVLYLGEAVFKSKQVAGKKNQDPSSKPQIPIKIPWGLRFGALNLLKAAGGRKMVNGNR